MKIHFKTRGELATALAAGAFAGKAVHLTVLHNDACTPSRCSCEPEFLAEDLTAETYTAGQRAQREWLKGTCS